MNGLVRMYWRNLFDNCLIEHCHCLQVGARMRAPYDPGVDVPNIFVEIPKGSFPGDSREALAKGLTAAAASAEQMPADPKKQFVTWV